MVKNAKNEGIDFKLHIVGFGLKEGETKQLICAAKEGDGQYYDASNAEGLAEVLQEATTVTIDDPPGNMSVYALKNGEPIDAVVKAYDIKSKRRPIGVRTYGDTALVYLPPSTYNLEVFPLGGSDVKPVTVEDVVTVEDQIIHKTVSFDGGRFKVKVTNNGEGWDALVKVLDASGKTVGTTRTYGKTQEIEVNPGNYDLSFQVLRIKGIETNFKKENLQINPGGIAEASYDFKSGKVFVDARADGKSIDSVVKFIEVESGKYVDGSRTYNKGAHFLLNPGRYTVSVKPIGAYKDRKIQTFTLVLKQGEELNKEVNF